MRQILHIVFGFVALHAGGAMAQPLVGISELPEPQREAYRRSLAEPYNLDLMFAAARGLEEAGRYDAAIRLYRRMLILDDTLSGIWLRAALLEYRMGNLAGALASLDALEGTAPSAGVARSADLLRDELEEARARHRVDGVVSSGWRFQSNANAAPDDAPLFLGLEAPLLSSSERDHSAFLDLALQHRFDPQRQDGRTFDTMLRFDGEKFLEVNEFDRIFARMTTGPRFQIDPSRPEWAVWRPYLLAEILSFGGELYSVAPGAGIAFSHELRHDVALSGEVEAGWRLHGSAAKVSFFDPAVPGEILPGQPTGLPLRFADDRDGLTVRAAFGAEWTPYPNLLLSAQPFFALRDARDDAATAIDVGIRGSATLLVESLRAAAPLQLTLAAQYWHAFYRDPDRQVTDNPGFVIAGLFAQPFLRRQDDGVRVDLLAELPLTDDVSAIGGLGWFHVDANIPNYAFDNFYTQLGLAWAF